MPADIIDYTQARRERGLPPTSIEARTLRTLALLDLLEEHRGGPGGMPEKDEDE